MKNEETLESLDKEAAIIAEKRKALLAKTRDAELGKAKAMVKIYGFTAAELEIDIVEIKPTKKARKARVANGTSTKVVAKLPPKYVNPEDSTKTWSGKGRKPNWILDLEKNKVDIETTIIKK